MIYNARCGNELLIIAVTNALEEDGMLNKIRAEIRSRVFQALNEDGLPRAEHATNPETKRLNHMIYQYLHFHGYSSTMAVFSAESNTNFGETSDFETTNNLPILYKLVARSEGHVTDLQPDPATMGPDVVAKKTVN